MKKIEKLLETVPGIKLYARHDIPEDLHYKNNKNSPPILIISHPGTIIMPSPGYKQRPYNNNNGSQNLVKLTSSAFSGYDPEEEDMRGIFLAKGPGIYKASN